jgi:hypothetical protein
LPALRIGKALLYQHAENLVLQRLQEAIHAQSWHDPRGFAAGLGYLDVRFLDALQLQKWS